MTQKCPKCLCPIDEEDGIYENEEEYGEICGYCKIKSLFKPSEEEEKRRKEFFIKHPYEIYVEPKECEFVNIDIRIVRFLGHPAFHFLYFLTRYCERNGKKEGTLEEIFEEMDVLSKIEKNKAIKILLNNVMITKKIIGRPKVKIFAINKDGVRNFLYYATKQLKLEHDQEQRE